MKLIPSVSCASVTIPLLYQFSHQGDEYHFYGRFHAQMHMKHPYLCAGSAIATMLLGVPYYAGIHLYAYFILVQIFGGVMQVYITVELTVITHKHTHTIKTTFWILKV